jgi:hypothetical protein
LGRLAVLSCALLLLVGATAPVFADDSDAGPQYASDDDLAAAFGDMHYSMASCGGDGWRTVQIDVQRFPLNAPNWVVVTHEATRRAMLFAWHNCPAQGEQFKAHAANGWVFETDNAKIVLPGGTVAFVAGDIEQIQNGQSALDYTHAGVQIGDSGMWWDSNGIYIWRILELTVLAIALLVWHKQIIRWYYLLTPHPATSMVRAAISGGVELDGEVFSEVIREMPGGQIERAVRNQQARELTELMQKSNAMLRRRAEELKEKVREQAVYQAAHADLNSAAVEQQLAAKRAEAFARMEEFLRKNRPA